MFIVEVYEIIALDVYGVSKLWVVIVLRLLVKVQ